MRATILLAVAAFVIGIAACDLAPSPDLVGFPTLPTQVKVMEPMRLAVSAKEPLEFMWWIKEPDKDWVNAKSWSQDLEFTYSPPRAGIYGVQIDFRKKQTPDKFTQKFIGQFTAVE